MFLTTALQSENSPLRTTKSYYKPMNRPSSKSMRKVFHKKCDGFNLHDMYDPVHKQQSIIKHLDNLGKAKGLQRREMMKKQDIHSFITFRKKPIQQLSTNHTITKDLSLSSIKLSPIQTSRVSSLCKVLDEKRNGSLTNRLKQFQYTMLTKKQDSKNELRFTFYSNEQKAKYIMEKYKQDAHLHERGSNLYQNIFNRTITRDKLFTTINQIDKKRRKGEII